MTKDREGHERLLSILCHLRQKTSRQARYLPISKPYFSLTSAGISERSVIIAVASALPQSQATAERSAGIRCATFCRIRCALVTLALKFPITISTVTDSSVSCQQS